MRVTTSITNGLNRQACRPLGAERKRTTTCSELPVHRCLFFLFASLLSLPPITCQATLTSLSPGGEAWPLVKEAATVSGLTTSVPLLVKLFTSGKPQYGALANDLGVQLTLRHTTSIAFETRKLLCHDILLEAKNFPAPKSCRTNIAGSLLEIIFYADQALRAATSYFFVVPILLKAASTNPAHRTIHAQTFESYQEIDSFGFVLDSPGALVAGPRLQSFSVNRPTPFSTATLVASQQFVLELKFAASSDTLTINPGLGDSILIWAIPLTLWDFSVAAPCVVEIGGTVTTGSGTCRFLRFPSSDTPLLQSSFGLNGIELVPTEQIKTAVVTFRLRLVAPAKGAALISSSKWFARPLRGGHASDYLRESTFGVGIDIVPKVTVARVSNVAAAATTKVLISIKTGVTFRGVGGMAIQVPQTFTLMSAEVETQGYSRLGGSGAEMATAAITTGNVVSIGIPSTGIVLESATYGIRLTLGNPSLPVLPTACTDVLRVLSSDPASIPGFSAGSFSTGTMPHFSLSISIGSPTVATGAATFPSFNVLPKLRGANIAPSQYGVGALRNELLIFFSLSIGLLTTDASIHLSGPVEYEFFCMTFVAPVAPLTYFPAVRQCTTASGLLMLDLLPDALHPYDVPLSFKVDVRNPTRQQALALEQQMILASSPTAMPPPHPSSLVSSRTAWALLVMARGVPCQAQVELRSPYQMAAWQPYQNSLTIQSLTTTGYQRGVDVFVNLVFTFSSRLPRFANVTFFAPVGFIFKGSFNVQAASTGAQVSLPVSTLPTTSNTQPHSVSISILSSSRTTVTYGFRAKVTNAALSPGTQAEPAPNLWTIVATNGTTLTSLLAGQVNLSSRYDAGNIAGYNLSALQACKIEANDKVYSRTNDLTVSFILHKSVYSTSTSVGKIQVAAPTGYVFQADCTVRPALPTLDVSQGEPVGDGFKYFRFTRCIGNQNKAEITINGAILQGSHVRFQLETINPAADPLANRWTLTTYQGFNVLEECEGTITVFTLTRTLVRATYEQGGSGEDLRLGVRSVYRFSFIWAAPPPANAMLLPQVTTISLTVPEGFTTLAACKSGASGANVLPNSNPLPTIVSCVGVGRRATFTLAGRITADVLYGFSVTVVNPPASYDYSQADARWMMEIDGASSGSMQRPAIRVLGGTRLIPGDTREHSNHWTKILFRTASAVPLGGGLGVYLPFPFQVGRCSASTWGLFQASQSSDLGTTAVASGTRCSVTLGVSFGQRHKILLFPLAAALPSFGYYMLALNITNGGLSSHASDSTGWNIYTAAVDEKVLDMSNTITSFNVYADLGNIQFTPPALTVPAGGTLYVDVQMTLRYTVRRGAVVIYPPPLILLRCDQTRSSSNLPTQSSCSVEGQPAHWLSHRLILRSLYFALSGAKTYNFRIEAIELGHELPYYRRSWKTDLIAGLSLSSTSLQGFMVASRAVDLWRWRGYLRGLTVTNNNPALFRRYNTYVDFTTNSTLTLLTAELWIRPPDEITAHAFSCRRAIASSASAVSASTQLLPVYCDVVVPQASPCSPQVWETAPCSDTSPNVSKTSLQFAHRRGLRVLLGRVNGGSFVRLSVETTPISAAPGLSVNALAQPGTWTVSIWENTLELDVAQGPGYAVRNWIDVTGFHPSSTVPEAFINVTIEWWMLLPLLANGRIIVRPPSYHNDMIMHDLSNAASLFNAGNLPTVNAGQSQPPVITAIATSIEVTVCCVLHAATRYRFTFGCKNPPARRMPAPSLLELNTWSILTTLPHPSTQIFHQQIIQGYSLSRPFQQATIVPFTKTTVGGVGAATPAGKITVKIEFMLPFATALHGPSEELKLIAPPGWEFPAVCIIDDLQLGPYTTIDSCRAADRELVLVLSGSINPGVQNIMFGFVVAVQPPPSTAENDIWALQGYAPYSSYENIIDPMAATRTSGEEIELRLTSTVFGMVRPNSTGPYNPESAGIVKEIVADVNLLPRNPQSLMEIWKLPSDYLGVVRFRLPTSVSLLLTNATLRLTGPAYLNLRCTFPPDPFIAGTLPPGIICIDNATQVITFGSGTQNRVNSPFEIVLDIDDQIPLRPLLVYNFTIAVHAPFYMPDQTKSHARWPQETSWSLSLMSGGAQFRTTAAATLAVEGTALPGFVIGDLGLLASTTKSNYHVEVMVLFSVGLKLELPLALEVKPPEDFILDSAPFPLHPALQPTQFGVNPFSSANWKQRTSTQAAAAAQVIASGQDLYGTPCPHFEMDARSPAQQNVYMPPDGRPNGSLCHDPPTRNTSMLTSCLPDSYKAIPAHLARCVVLHGKAVIKLHRRNLSSYQSALDRDQTYCSRFVCLDLYDHAWLASGQYRVTLRGFNPPQPLSVADNIWSLTVAHEVRPLGGGPRSTIEPLGAANTPGYRIDASATYSDQVSPVVGMAVRGGTSWYDTGSRLPAMYVNQSAIMQNAHLSSTAVLGTSR